MTTRPPRLLDLFCGAGGAAMGYHRAGFEVVGVDLEPQPRYPFAFERADAMTFPLKGFDAVHASPPCQAYTALRTLHPDRIYVDLIGRTRNRLRRSGLPWVIENVPGAPLRDPVTLCGTEFSLNVVDGGVYWLARHRVFESDRPVPAASGCRCRGRAVMGVYGHGGGANPAPGKGRKARLSEARTLLGIGWMTGPELAQAVPPAYTEYIGRWLIRRTTV